MKLRLLRYFFHWLGHQKRYAYLKQLLANEKLDTDALQKKQWQLLEEITLYARQKVPFYQKFYPELKQGFDKNRFKTLPVLTKQHILQNLQQMLSHDFDFDKDGVKIGQTSGSTGQPLKFYYDNNKMELMRAGMCRSYMWSGWKPGEKILNFWGAKQDIKKRSYLKQYWKEFIAAEKTIPCYQYSNSDIKQWVSVINHYKPVLLQGYASVLLELADYIQHNRIKLHIMPKGIYTTAEVLLPQHKQRIEKAFQCPVFNQYGSREIPNIALSCKHNNMHIFSDLVYLESQSVNGDDLLLISSLSNKLMPMIRYQNGDSGKPSNKKCACGSPFPLMEMSFGRSNDIIVTPSGKKIYPAFFHHILDNIEHIKQFRFIQQTKKQIVLEYQAKIPLNEQQKQVAQKKLSDASANELALQFQQRDKISPLASGKHRFIIRTQKHD